MIEVLLEYKADVDAQNQKGETALHLVAHPSRDYPRVADLLLKAGASISIQDSEGITPLEISGPRCKELLLSAKDAGKNGKKGE